MGIDGSLKGIWDHDKGYIMPQWLFLFELGGPLII